MCLTLKTKNIAIIKPYLVFHENFFCVVIDCFLTSFHLFISCPRAFDFLCESNALFLFMIAKQQIYFLNKPCLFSHFHTFFYRFIKIFPRYFIGFNILFDSENLFHKSNQIALIHHIFRQNLAISSQKSRKTLQIHI